MSDLKIYLGKVYVGLRAWRVGNEIFLKPKISIFQKLIKKRIFLKTKIWTFHKLIQKKKISQKKINIYQLSKN